MLHYIFNKALPLSQRHLSFFRSFFLLSYCSPIIWVLHTSMKNGPDRLLDQLRSTYETTLTMLFQ